MKNFKLITFLFAILLVTSSTFGQDSKIGLRFGLNNSTLSGDDSKEFDGSKSGIAAGIYYDYIYTDIIGAEAGMVYSQNGAPGSNDSTSLNLDYLDFPILLKVYVTRNISITPGVQYSFLMRSEDGLGNDASEFIKPFDFSAIIGAEYKFDFGLAFNLRYRAGLTSIGAEFEDYSQNNSTFTTTQLDLKNNALQVSVNYTF